MTAPRTPAEQAVFDSLRELEAVWDRRRQEYEQKIENLTNERDLYRATAADLQSQLDRHRAHHGVQSTAL